MDGGKSYHPMPESIRRPLDNMVHTTDFARLYLLFTYADDEGILLKHSGKRVKREDLFSILNVRK